MFVRTMIAAAALIGILATGSAQAGELKIGVVRIQDVFAQYKKTTDTKTKMEAEFKILTNRIDQLQEMLRKKSDEVKALSPEKRGGLDWFRLMQATKELEFRIKSEKEDFQRQLNTRMCEFYKAVFQDFQIACREFAEANGYALILRAADDELSNESHVGIQNEIGLKILHFYSKSLDVTDQILAHMNRKYQPAK